MKSMSNSMSFGDKINLLYHNATSHFMLNEILTELRKGIERCSLKRGHYWRKRESDYFEFILAFSADNF